MLTLVKRAWVPLVVVVAVTVGGVAVDRLRGVFGSDAIFTATGSSARPLEPSHVKQVTYEVYGPGETSGSVSYLDKNAQPQQADFTNLPWSYTIETTVPAVMANLVAQGNSDTIGCRITVNGEVKAEHSSAGRDAQTFCLVKAA
ncbi:MmpS family transport accessory protein [Mycobacterium sp. Marseille-P9652]|uniref:MmpS family transport accessory protein n=1 Tax=Mycobacterium sp. Marseille-P9652 TaxID=2654950 RepID=UPI0012E71E2B|nr:MmpS family transport accessory protein [Mycobacterium sp. Marseille-P9652]